MTHHDNDDFVGNQLRLTAFLRVVDSIPKRPYAYRRRRIPQQTSSDLCIARADLDENENNDHCEHHSPIAADDITSNPRIHDKPTIQHVKQSLDDLPRRTSIRGKRRLPVNELALIRTSTTNGLPDYCEDLASSIRPITDIDPIEDSQPISGSRPTQRLLLPPRSDSSRVHASTQNELQTAFRRNIPTFHARTVKRLQKTRPTKRIHSPLKSKPVADGFSELELEIQRKALMPRARKPQQKHQFAKVSRSRELPLATGALPFPSAFGSTTSKDDRTRACVHPINQVDSRSRSSDSSSRAMAIDQINAQLSSITAPEREGSESDTSGSQVSSMDHDYGTEGYGSDEVWCTSSP